MIPLYDKDKTVNITTGVEYATNEYIDGKQVYRKRIDCGALPDNNQKSISINLSNINYIRFSGVAVSSSSLFPLPYVDFTLNTSIKIWINGNVLYIKTQYTYSNYKAYVDLYYTKN